MSSRWGRIADNLMRVIYASRWRILTHGFQLRDDRLNHRKNTRTTRFHHETCRFPIQRITYNVQLLQCCKRVGHLKQRTVLVMADPPENFLGRRMKINRKAAVLKHVPSVRMQNHTAAC